MTHRLPSVRRLQPSIGAEIGGIDLSRPLSEEVCAHLNSALAEHKVLFFRDQALSHDQYVAFGRCFGEVVPRPGARDARTAEIGDIASDGKLKGGTDIWHSDDSYTEAPLAGSLLRACLLPSLGGDTLFASATAAYESLPDAIKDRIDGLHAVHDAEIGYAKAPRELVNDQTLKHIAAAYPPRSHPLVCLHPKTGKKLVYANEAFTTRIVGIEPDESAELLRRIFDQFRRPEHQVRFRWRVNSIAVFDNLAVQHYAVADYDEPRRLEKILLKGGSLIAA